MRTDLATYSIARTGPMHRRQATCAEIGCPNHVRGWTIDVDTTSALGRRQRDYLDSRRHGRMFTTSRTGPGIIRYSFYPGQECFTEHTTDTAAPALYLVRQGPSNQRGPLLRRHTRPEDWAEDLHETTDRAVSRIQKG